MAQHPLTFADSDGATFLAALNSAFAAVKSTNSGGNRPPNAVAQQLWVDTNTPSATVWTLFMFDGAEDIPLGTIDTVANRFTGAASSIGAALQWAADQAAARAVIGALGAGAVTGSGLTMASARLLGRGAAGSGAVEEVSLGAGLGLSGGVLACALSNSARLLGRAAAGAGAAEEIAIGAGLSLTGGVLASTVTGSAPTPTTAAAVGQWARLDSNALSQAFLPAGGTWAWFVSNAGVGVSAGGTNVPSAGAGLVGVGFAWRIA